MPREHDASQNPRFLASWPFRSLVYNRKKTALTSRRGRGSELFLLDKRRDLSVNLQE